MWNTDGPATDPEPIGPMCRSTTSSDAHPAHPLPLSRDDTPRTPEPGTTAMPREYNAFESGLDLDGVMSDPCTLNPRHAAQLASRTTPDVIHEDPEKDALPPPMFLYSGLPHPPDDLATKIYKRSPQPDCYTLVVVGQVRKDSLQFTTVCRMIVLWCGGRVAFGDCLQGPPFNPKRNSGMLRLWVHNEALAAVLDVNQKYWLGRRGIYAVDDTVKQFLREAHVYLRHRCLALFPVTVQIAQTVPGKHSPRVIPAVTMLQSRCIQ